VFRFLLVSDWPSLLEQCHRKLGERLSCQSNNGRLAHPSTSVVAVVLRSDLVVTVESTGNDAEHQWDRVVTVQSRLSAQG
jgi:hypothetical protein